MDALDDILNELTGMRWFICRILKDTDLILGETYATARGCAVEIIAGPDKQELIEEVYLTLFNNKTHYYGEHAHVILENHELHYNVKYERPHER